jgi:hypothetical protein
VVSVAKKVVKRFLVVLKAAVTPEVEMIHFPVAMETLEAMVPKP